MYNYMEREYLLINYLLIVYILSCVYIFLKLNIMYCIKLVCNNFYAAPKPTAPTICIESQEPECGFGQIMKAVIDDNGCHKFICRTYIYIYIHVISFINYLSNCVRNLSNKLYNIA